MKVNGFQDFTAIQLGFKKMNVMLLGENKFDIMSFILLVFKTFLRYQISSKLKLREGNRTIAIAVYDYSKSIFTSLAFHSILRFLENI